MGSLPRAGVHCPGQEESGCGFTAQGKRRVDVERTTSHKDWGEPTFPCPCRALLPPGKLCGSHHLSEPAVRPQVSSAHLDTGIILVPAEQSQGTWAGLLNIRNKRISLEVKCGKSGTFQAEQSPNQSLRLCRSSQYGADRRGIKWFR